MTTDDAIKKLRKDRTEASSVIVAEAMAIQALTRQRLEELDICMFCPNCRYGVHKHIYNADNKPFEVKYCPFCGEKLEWE